MTAAIIGGGIAGLTAAYELVKANERPYLLEPGPIGGMVRTSTQNGFTLEMGPNVLVSRPDLKYLLGELGLDDAVRYPIIPAYGQYVWFEGGVRKVPKGFLSLLASPLFSTAAKTLIPFKVLLPGILPRERNDYSVRDFFAPLIGAKAVDALLDPVLKGIYGGDVGELSARTLFPGLWDAARQGRSIVGYMSSRRTGAKAQVMVIQGGMQTLTERLWQEIKPHVNFIPRKVDRIIPSEEGKRFKLLVQGADAIDVDGCVVTTAGPVSAPLVAYMNEALSDALVNVKAASLSVVHLAVPRSAPLIPGAFGVLFPAGMPENLLGVMFNSLLFPHVAPADSHILTVIVGGAQAGETMPDEAHLRQRLPALLKELLAIESSRWLSMVHWPHAIPQLTAGHHEIVEQLDECEQRYPGVVFAGVDRGGVGVSDRVRIAREAVKRFRRVRVETAV